MAAIGWRCRTLLAVVVLSTWASAISCVTSREAPEQVVVDTTVRRTTTTERSTTTTRAAPTTTVRTSSTSTTEVVIEENNDEILEQQRGLDVRMACASLRGDGERSDPYLIPFHPGRRVVLEGCDGFPLGRGQPDWYLFEVPPDYSADSVVFIEYTLTQAEPAESTLVMDDVGPYAMNIRGERFVDGAYVQRWIRLADIQPEPGEWYLRVGRLNDVSSSPDFTLVIDLR